jgi:hypothetical protein
MAGKPGEEVAGDLPSNYRQGSYNLLLGLGIVWLLLGFGLLLYQTSSPTAVRVEWETATEVNTAGFFLYRSDDADGQFLQVNDELIAAVGDSQSGASYSFVDKNVSSGNTYFYLLEEVELDSTRSRYFDDLLSYRVPQTWWTLAISALGMVVGTALLVAGLRERRRII